jgi:hypothetical protein
MASRLDSRVRTYEIGYTGYYYEMSEWYSSVVEAIDKQDALKQFAQQGDLELPSREIESWRWEEGPWLMAFCYIKEVEIQTCPTCHGTGTLRIARHD